MKSVESQLAQALSISDLRVIAKRRLPRAVFEFIDGGSEDEITLRENRSAFERVRLLPRVLNDVSAPDIRTMLAGKEAQAPIVIAPMGSCMLAWPQADIAIARAAAALGLPYTLSTMSTTSIEAMAQAVQGELWFQLYVLKDRAFNDQLVARAQSAGYGALVVTVDLPAGGKRERDLRNGITVPLRINMRQILSGIAKHFAPEDIIGKQVTFLANLAPRTMMGHESQGMILMAEDSDGKLALIAPGDAVWNGGGVS